MRWSVLALLVLVLAGAAVAEPYRDEINTNSGGGQWQPGDPLYEGGGTERDHFGTAGRSTGGEKCVGNVIPVDKIAGGKSWSPGCYAIRGDRRHACCGCISSPDDPYSVEEFKSEGLPVCGAQQPDGAKDIYRESNDPRYPGQPGHVGIERLAEAIDDCMDKSVQRGWGLWDPPSLVEYSQGVAYYEGGSVYYNPGKLGSMPVQRQVYALARAYAGHALYLRDRYLQHGQPGKYEAAQPSSVDTDRIVGYVTHCLMNTGLIEAPINKDPDDPRVTYGMSVGGNAPRLDAFDRGFQSWPLSPLYRPKLDPAHR